MVLSGVEVAVTAMVRRWQRGLFEVQQRYGFDQVDDTMRRLDEQVDAVGGGGAAVTRVFHLLLDKEILDLHLPSSLLSVCKPARFKFNLYRSV